MQKYPKKQIVILLYLIIMQVFSSANGEAPKRLSLMNADWKKAEVIDREQFTKQAQFLWDLFVKDRALRKRSDSEILTSLQQATDMFWYKSRKAKKKSNGYLDKLAFTPTSIPGYKIVIRDQYSWQEAGERKDKFDIIFQIESDQFENFRQPTPSITGSEGDIRVKIACCLISEAVQSFIFSGVMYDTIFYSSMSPTRHLSLYEIDKGPGDACLVHVVMRPSLGTRPKADDDVTLTLSDSRVVFVRGNVAVYLTSSYENCGGGGEEGTR